MAYWLAKKRNGQHSDWIARFDPRFWTVNFPRPMMAAVTTTAPDALRVDCVFYRKNDLAGLIWDSVDTLDHPLTSYDTNRDYTGLTVSFRWRSGGIVQLDQLNGPTLTIEGRDADGAARTWYVRLWNYAEGSPTDAAITIDFDSLDGGFLLPAEADPVHCADIDRMFVSLVPPGFDPAGGDLAAPVEGWAEISDLRTDGNGALLEIGDVMTPEHGIGMCTAFDDCGTQTPERLLRNIRALGYRGEIVHYLGMSHYFQLKPEGDGYVIDTGAAALNRPAEAWHADFFARCAAMGFEPVASLSYELLAMHCPQAWTQRDLDGNPALTGWSPPSNILSPANDDAMAFLQQVARAAVSLMTENGAEAKFQIGEPWWWTYADGRICLYDDEARDAFGGAPVAIPSLRDPLDAAQTQLLDQAGAILAASTAALADAVREEEGAEVRLLTFLPTVLDPLTPESDRANLPEGWAYPAFDRLQIEDYDWLTAGRSGDRLKAYAIADERLGYPVELQDYLSGFVLLDEDASNFWPLIDAGLNEAGERSVNRQFVWASPQVMRDGYVRLPTPRNEDAMQEFDDIPYPLALGRGAAVSPEFSTTIVITASGHEHRNSVWSDARLRYDVGPGIRSEAELGTLLSFFRARRGAARGFRLRDPNDYSSNGMTGAPSAFDQLLGLGDGVQTIFPLIKSYGSDDAQERRITRPVSETIQISVDGVETSAWSIGQRGVIRLHDAAPPGAQVRAGYLFDVPVRFAEDRLEVSNAAFAAGEAPSVPLIEVREAA
ncbi:DUF2460 domain-containing protein [Croceicoccus gelatinilyticus]|uniref:DUF2460 domain-containing protein n=1 Tax=Croceicoccus gelatinilyticus TaxID=2835536 RepID=UPI001BCFFB4F|nr:DUF2460 domain-containing protein [Croceicoccus gelatinilyticus]MBS7668216.1 DUF2460 domain-containing protein [Croceicoccus gelatinilyticus]